MNELDKRLRRVMKTVTIHNTDPDNRAFFMYPNEGYAYGGHRRAWGAGDMLVRYIGDIDAPVGMRGPGVLTIDSEEYFPDEFLRGRRLPSGGRELMTPEMCAQAFDNVFQNVKGHHQLIVNPKMVVEFINERTARDGLAERVINIHPFEVANSLGHFAAQVDYYEDQLVVNFKMKGEMYAFFIDEKKSLIDTRILRAGNWVIVAPDAVVDGVRWVRVMREFEPGIRMAIQHLKNGTKMPDDPKYSILPGEDNNDIKKADIRDFPFFEGQEKRQLRTAPMLTVQLDTFYRAMLAMSEYELVEILFKDSFSIFAISPFVYEGEPVVQALVSPISPYVLGKVVTV